MKRITFVLITGGVLFFGYFFMDKEERQRENDISAKSEQREALVQLNEKEARIFRFLLKDDLRSFADGAENFFGSAYKPLPIVTSADTMQRDYELNEVAGNQTYRGLDIILSGKIASVDRSMGENYFISLRGGSNPFMMPKAKMADGYIDFLAALKKNQNVHLFCKGEGMLMGSSMLSGCVPVEKWVDTTVEILLGSWRKFVIAKDEYISRLVVATHIFVESLPEMSTCLKTGEHVACTNELMKIKPDLSANRLKEIGKKFGIDVQFLAQK